MVVFQQEMAPPLGRKLSPVPWEANKNVTRSRGIYFLFLSVFLLNRVYRVYREKNISLKNLLGLDNLSLKPLRLILGSWVALFYVPVCHSKMIVIMLICGSFQISHKCPTDTFNYNLYEKNRFVQGNILRTSFWVRYTPLNYYRCIKALRIR